MHEGHRERMWERLYAYGDSMSDHELLEVLLFYAIPRKNTNLVAHELLAAFGSLRGLFSASPEEIEKVAGVGRKTADFIRLVGLFMARCGKAREEKTGLSSLADVQNFVRARFRDADRERAEIYFIDAHFRLLCAKTFTDFSRAQVAFDARDLNSLLGTVRPNAIILAHNHPSGDATPSSADDSAVREAAGVCRINAVNLLDSVIYGSEQEIFSYYCAGRLPECFSRGKTK